MNFKNLLAVAVLSLCAVTAQGAPLWNSVVLDDYSLPDDSGNGLNFGMAASIGAAYWNSTVASFESPSITGNRDGGLFKNSGSINSAISSTLEINTPGNPGQMKYTDLTNFNVAGTQRGFILQNDYGAELTSLVPTADYVGGAVIAPSWYSKFVIDVAAVTGSFEVTFTVLGADDGSGGTTNYAEATETVTSAGLVDFDIHDFTKFGDFATTTPTGQSWINWADVQGFAVNAVTTTSGGSITFNGVYATIPEPGSMLAMAGLFGGAGLIGIRGRRQAKRDAAA